MNLPFGTDDVLDEPLQRMPRREPRKLVDLAIPGLAFAGGGMLVLGLVDLLGADSLVDYGKCLLMGAAASAVALVVNKLAIERWARQAAIGMPGAVPLSMGMMGLVGAALCTSTFAGFTLDQVDRLQMVTFGQSQAAYIQQYQQLAMEGAQVIPGVRAIVDDLSAKEGCEVDGCLTGGVGDGPTSRALTSERQRAEAILASLEQGVDLRVSIFADLNRLQASFHEMLSDDGLSIKERRVRASDLAMHVTQSAAMLAETDPVAYVASYAEELGSGGGANDVINDLRRGYAQQLRSAVATVEAVQPAAPSLPSTTGVVDTLGYIGKFLPIFLVVLTADALLPFALWMTVVMSYRARLAHEETLTPTTPTDLIRRNGDARPPRTPH